MAESQRHEPGTMAFGTHDLPQDLQPKADLIARLRRSSVGASEQEAAELVDLLPALVLRSESDELLANRVRDYKKRGSVFLPGEHTVKDVLSFVGDDVTKARATLESEQGKDGKNRSTLVEKLNEVIDAGQSTTPPVVAAAPASDDAPHV